MVRLHVGVIFYFEYNSNLVFIITFIVSHMHILIFIYKQIFKHNQTKSSVFISFSSGTDKQIQWETDHQIGVEGCFRVNDSTCVEHWCRNFGGRLRNTKFPTTDIVCEKIEKGRKVLTVQKNASIRGKGGHRLTAAKATQLQTQVKRVVKSVTKEKLGEMEKVKKMRKGIRAVFLHNTMVKPAQHRHKYCAKGLHSWCGWRRHEAGDTTEYEIL